VAQVRVRLRLRMCVRVRLYALSVACRRYRYTAERGGAQRCVRSREVASRDVGLLLNGAATRERERERREMERGKRVR